MSDKKSIKPNDLFEHENQSSSLKEFLRAVEVARRQFSLYGIDHPNSAEMVERLSNSVGAFVEPYERATCVFTEDAVIVNEHYFASSPDSIQLFQRIRARGAMAITLLGLPPTDQLREFILFLNIEPREVRLQGGPCSFLRKNGVSRIVLTESVYTVGDPYNIESNEQEDQNMDIAVASAIHWLTRQDEGNQDLPNLPITQILSNPESAAKLIREAVTKLHASKRDHTSGEIACDVVNDMKSLASTAPQEWDKATGQIRKTIAKLPSEMQPSFSGFTFSEEPDGKGNGSVDINEIEIMMTDLLKNGSNESVDAAVPEEIESLFGMRAHGPLSSWRNELQPSSVMVSTGTTLITIMKWESSACEHGRIAMALSELILRAVEIHDVDCALLFAGALIDEANCNSEEGWRRSNARSALAGLEPGVLTNLIRGAIASESHDAKRAAASLVELHPELAPEMADLLERHIPEEFRQALTSAIIKAGSSASTALSNLLHNGNPAGKMAALETLIETGRAWALEEVAEIIKGNDLALALQAIRLLPNARIPLAAEILTNAASHSNMQIRCAALEALGEFGDQSKLDFLDAVARRRPLFGRARYEAVRQAAKRAADHIRQEHPKAA